MINQNAFLNPKLFEEDIFNYQKTALADGFNATVDGKPTIASPAELIIIYHILRKLSKNTSVDRTGFEPAPSVGETGSLPLTYRPKPRRLLHYSIDLKGKSNYVK